MKVNSSTISDKFVNFNPSEDKSFTTVDECRSSDVMHVRCGDPFCGIKPPSLQIIGRRVLAQSVMRTARSDSSSLITEYKKRAMEPLGMK